MTNKLFFVVFLFFVSTVVLSQNDLFYWPICQNPQNIAPMQNAGGSQIVARSSVVWNGKDYAVVWVDYADFRLHFRRFYADGTPASSATIPSTLFSYHYSPPKIVWNGSGYGVAWVAWSGFKYQIYFLKLDQNGAPIGSPLKVSFVGISETASCYAPDLAYSGNGYCVTWHDNRNGNKDIFATLLNNSGAITYSDTPISAAPNDQYLPRIAWSNGVGKYQIVWNDSRSGSKYEIYGSQISPSNVVTSNTQLVSGTSNSYDPVVADMGNGLGMAWEDYRDGNWEIYFAKLSADGSKIGTDIRVTNNSSDQLSPAIVWTGAEFGIFWMDYRNGNYEIFFQRVSSSGTILGSNTQVTYSGDMEYPDAAFARYGYLATGAMYGGANYVSAWGCANDTTPPSCPQNLVAYNITGTSATIAWIPSVEDYTDIAYYEVYRNSNLLGLTSNNYYTDTGLSLSTTYNYYVRPVNAAQIINGECTNSIYIKTNATLTLLVNKNNPNAKLTWNDEKLNNYNVYRGTSPQVMTLIGNTSGQEFDDPNVLLDNVTYFYTVDEPGW